MSTKQNNETDDPETQRKVRVEAQFGWYNATVHNVRFHISNKMLTIYCLIHGNKALEDKSATVNILVPTMFNYQSGLPFCKLLQDHKIIKFEDGEIEDQIKAQERIINENAKITKDLPGTECSILVNALQPSTRTSRIGSGEPIEVLSPDNDTFQFMYPQGCCLCGKSIRLNHK